MTLENICHGHCSQEAHSSLPIKRTLEISHNNTLLPRSDIISFDMKIFAFISCLCCVSSYLSYSSRIFPLRSSLSLAKDEFEKSFVDDFPGLKIGVKSLDEIKEERNEELRERGVTGLLEESVPTQVPLKKVPTKTKNFGSFDIEELYRKSNVAMKEMKSPQKRQEDFSNVNPLQSFGSAVIALVMCACAWIVSSYLAQNFAVDYVQSELYPVQRVAIVGRNLVVGIFSLASGFTGMVSLGLLLLTGRVIYGQVRGEFSEKKDL